MPDTSEAWDLPKEIPALAVGISYSNGVQAAYSFIKLLEKEKGHFWTYKGDELALGFER